MEFDFKRPALTHVKNSASHTSAALSFPAPPHLVCSSPFSLLLTQAPLKNTAFRHLDFQPLAPALHCKLECVLSTQPASTPSPVSCKALMRGGRSYQRLGERRTKSGRIVRATFLIPSASGFILRYISCSDAGRQPSTDRVPKVFLGAAHRSRGVWRSAGKTFSPDSVWAVCRGAALQCGGVQYHFGESWYNWNWQLAPRFPTRRLA